MATELENPVITDETEAKFLEAAALADKGQDIPADLVPAEPADTATAPENKEEKPGGQPQTDNSETDLEKKDDRPRDELGRFTKTKEGKDIPEAERQPAEKPAEQKPTGQQPAPSDYQTAKEQQKQKEQERLEKTWENVNRRKDELEARERALQQQEQSLRQQPQQQFQQQPQRQFSSQDLFEAAKDFKSRARQAFKRYQETGNEAELEAFNENDALAEQAEQHAQQFYQVEARELQQVQMERYRQVWDGNMQKAVQADPDLIKADAPIAQAVHSLLETHGDVFYMIPDGFAKAVEIAKLRLEAGSASELRKANEKLQAEVERLNGLTAIGGSGPTSQPAPKKLEDMSDEEQDAHFRRAAQMADSGQLT